MKRSGMKSLAASVEKRIVALLSQPDASENLSMTNPFQDRPPCTTIYVFLNIIWYKVKPILLNIRYVIWKGENHLRWFSPH
ncbi:MAG: hypothetical protein KDD67_05270 [Ignavibacteriae bacterium]|nr:hypothetical protein [Ignavibacteriota bacterium]